ncbi:type IV pilin [Halobaculum magnesiiphilum]|uniref:Type IV pilin N-terminal domain-containing protein n=1 Tax=Halobaculum magnesiiphilum TaxID=1017351 RepID=A0A8T8WCK1_9EURY|nr:type IV pilin N-terminal domain-containing protein [Halobaculum magnesiiphilum]QZP37602.1 type IV pilin N-terminal domain-containing protein [Halobaculum magnesiiphilum]
MTATPQHGPSSRDRAVTPVIATVTMVAITVVLAAVLGAAMLGLPGGLAAGPPSLTVDFTYRSVGTDYEVTASIHGGETVTKENTGNLTLVADSGHERAALKTRYPLTGGDSIVLSDETEGPVPPGTEVRLVWSGPEGRTSVVLARGQTPF